MSMNLIFVSNSCGHVEDFPYQTSTKLTYDVMKAKSTDEKIEMIKKDLALHTDTRLQKIYIKKIKDMLNNGYTLGVI